MCRVRREHFRDEHVKALKEHLLYSSISSIVAKRERNDFAPDLRVYEMLS